MPASDNRPALYFMTSLQFGLGTFLLNRARRSFRISRYFSTTLNVLASVTLIFGSGLEFMRLNVPFDPWQSEAQVFRKLAISKGESPSLWFGPYKWYTPVSLDVWTDQLKRYILATNKELTEFPNHAVPISTSENPNTPVGDILVKMHNSSKYNEIYTKLSEQNIRRMAQLGGELGNVNEDNKKERFDLGKQVNLNFLKNPITLGNHGIDSETGFEMAWETFDPWDELKIEVESEVRLVPLSPRSS